MEYMEFTFQPFHGMRGDIVSTLDKFLVRLGESKFLIINDVTTHNITLRQNVIFDTKSYFSLHMSQQKVQAKRCSFVTLCVA